MLRMSYEGWFQCRMATDPDPTDERRGLSGPTIATPSEPDMDRIVRLQEFVSERWPSKRPGVFVTDVAINGVSTPNHVLQGATVDFLDGAQFRQLNMIIVAGLRAPIDPFHIRFRSPTGTVVVSRRDEWDITRPGLTIDDIFTDDAILDHRNNTVGINDPEVAEATGVMDFAGYRLDRLNALTSYLATLAPADPTRADVEQRIVLLKRDATQQGATLSAKVFLGMRCDYTMSINGKAVVTDPENELGGRLGVSQDWTMVYWLGGFDVDLMMGYMRGSIDIPFVTNATGSV